MSEERYYQVVHEILEGVASKRYRTPDDIPRELLDEYLSLRKLYGKEIGEAEREAFDAEMESLDEITRLNEFAGELFGISQEKLRVAFRQSRRPEASPYQSIRDLARDYRAFLKQKLESGTPFNPDLPACSV